MDVARSEDGAETARLKLPRSQRRPSCSQDRDRRRDVNPYRLNCGMYVALVRNYVDRVSLDSKMQWYINDDITKT